MIDVVVTASDYILADLLASLQQVISGKTMPKTAKAMRAGSALIACTWKSYVMGSPIPGSSMRVKNAIPEYASSIKVRTVSPFFHQIYTDYSRAKDLEQGTKSLDMKKTHPYGPRGRVSKDGVPYNIIPFRHGTPGSLTSPPMPSALYRRIQQEIKSGQMQLSSVAKGKTRSPNAKGELIPRARYNWGSRISGGVDRFEGMVAMNVSTPSSKRTEYLTFRVISKNSPSFKWIVKARPVLRLTHHVVVNTKAIIGEMVTQGIKEDVGLA